MKYATIVTIDVWPCLLPEDTDTRNFFRNKGLAFEQNEPLVARFRDYSNTYTEPGELQNRVRQAMQELEHLMSLQEDYTQQY